MPKTKKPAYKPATKGWCTKFALTRGIYPVEVQLRRAPREGGWTACCASYGVISDDPRGSVDYLDEGVDFFRTKTQAKQRAIQMAEDTIVSLKARIAKLQNQLVNPKVLTKDPRRGFWRAV